MSDPLQEHMRDDMYKTFLQLPLKTFMYTIDQIAYMLDITEFTLKKNILYFKGRERRRPTKDDLMAVNFARPEAPPEWRVSEEEFMRWMRFKRIAFSTPNRIDATRRK